MLLLGSPVWAAVTANSIISAQTPNRGLLQFLPASTPGTYGTLYTSGANGSRCNALWLDTNDTATHVVTCQIVNGGVKYGSLTITSAAGTGSQAFATPQNLLSPVVWPGLPPDSDGNPFLQLISGDTLQCTYATAVTTSDQVDLHTQCSDF
jgi:hypothetical protein